MNLYQDIFQRGLAARIDAERQVSSGVKLQLQHALKSCGIEENFASLNIFNVTEADRARVTEIHEQVKATFAATLNAYQGHFRVAEKLQKQLVQPRAAMLKAQERYDDIEAQIKAAGDEVSEKLKGQLGSSNGQLQQAKVRVDAIQIQIDAEFEGARQDKPAFLDARRADEYTRLFFSIIENPRSHWSTEALLTLQASIEQTHMWNPALAHLV